MIKNNQSYSLPKYSSAITSFYNEYSDQLHMEDDLLKLFPPVRLTHSGKMRFAKDDKVYDLPFELHKGKSNSEVNAFTETNCYEFKRFLTEIINQLHTDLRQQTGMIIEKQCTVINSACDAKDKNIWDVYIAIIEKIKIKFERGKPVFALYPLNIYKKLKETPPTEAQSIRVLNIFQIKKEEYYGNKKRRVII